LIEALADFVRRRQLVAIGARGLGARAFFANDVGAKLDGLVANEYRRARNELAHLVLTLAAERAIKKLIAGGFVGHSTICSRNLWRNLRFDLRFHFTRP